MKNFNYFKEEVFDVEMDLWKSQFLFVGLSSDLKKHNDFITLNTAFANIVIQNFRGEIKAFDNVCLHRFSSIQSESKGNRPLVCPYHSWGYDSNGCTRMHSKQLRNYPVEIVGVFVFVKLSIDPELNIQQFLGSFYDKLLEISSAVNSQLGVGETSIKHYANWKLLVENVLECYHCQSVHKESLGVLGLGKGIPYNYNSINFHNSIEYPLEMDTKSINPKKLDFLETRKLKHESYLHMYIFPNLFISSSGGRFFYVGRMDPMNSRMTQLKMNFLSPEASGSNEMVLKAYLDLNRENTIKVVMEDKSVIENLFVNMEKVQDGEQIFGSLEERITDFHHLLKRRIEAHCK